MSLAGVALVAAAAIAQETCLIRYFSVTSWAEHGAWVISIAMLGFALAGVVLCLLPAGACDRGERWSFVLCAAMLVLLPAGMFAAGRIPFNPQALQHPGLAAAEVLHAALFSAALAPFFACAGAYLGLAFIGWQRRIGLAYAWDLGGAAAGALGLVAAMGLVSPLALPACVPLPILLAGLCGTQRSRGRAAGLGILWALGTAALGWWPPGEFAEYKDAYGPLHTAGSRVVVERRSARGWDLVVAAFTERTDVDLSANAGALGAGRGLPAALGLYRDGNRLSALPAGPPPPSFAYARAGLDALPYLLRPGGRALLVGSRGGFRPAEALALGAAAVEALEPDPGLRALIAAAWEQGWPGAPRVRLVAGAPLAHLAHAAPGAYGLAEVSAEFAGQSEANETVLTVEGIRALGRAAGIVLLPASAREHGADGRKLVATATAALGGPAAAAPRLLVWRSTWGVRVAVSALPFTAADVRAALAFCDERSFDVLVAPGVNPAAHEPWNEPAPEPGDGRWFDERPATLARPFVRATLRMAALPGVFERLAELPREHLGTLTALAILVQAVPGAVLVLLLPLLARGRMPAPARRAAPRAAVYFAALGAGYLLVEIALMGEAAVLLGDRTVAFALVLGGMLAGSGAGSWLAGRRPALARAAPGAAAILLLVSAWGWPRLAAVGAGWPFAVQCVTVMVVLLPLAVPMGMPFPAGLAALGGGRRALVPWAMAVNGACGVIAGPLAALLARSLGWPAVLLCAAGLYGAARVARP